ncbi:MAG: hypothetical protein ACYTG0_37585 [Planctomycetota bacterium]
MSDFHEAARADNPFSTQHVRPGAIPFLFPHGHGAATLVDRLQSNRWQGQIIGPHGSGKSALVATLIPVMEARGRRTVLIELHDGQRRLPVNLRRMAELTETAVLIVDGYEQLAFCSRWVLRRRCRRRGLGLVVTAHASVGLPDLFRATTSLGLAGQIVGQLQGENPNRVSAEELRRRFAVHDGNLREVLFDLYDWHEERRP